MTDLKNCGYKEYLNREPTGHYSYDRRQKISENLLLLSIRYWLPQGTIDPMMISYLLLIAMAFCNKWKVICEGKIINMLNGVRIHANAFFQ